MSLNSYIIVPLRKRLCGSDPEPILMDVLVSTVVCGDKDHFEANAD